jgi:hypothetical protein
MREEFYLQIWGKYAPAVDTVHLSRLSDTSGALGTTDKPGILQPVRRAIESRLLRELRLYLPESG